MSLGVKYTASSVHGTGCPDVILAWLGRFTKTCWIGTMSETPPARAQTESLSLAEMLRIMDVATEMRSRRETVEKEFAIDDTKRILREKLLQTTAITGERVTEAEVDAAIESYFSTLYTFQEPSSGLAVTLARFYVRRGHVMIVGLLAVVLLVTGWLAMRIASDRFSPAARLTRQVSRLNTSVAANLVRAQALAREPEVQEELKQWQQELAVARDQQDVQTLDTLGKKLSELISELNEAYEVRILADPKAKSGFDRYFEEADNRPTAYYVIVYAQNEQGQSIRRKIENAETRQTSVVERWAEQVPKDVYERLKEDKKADGVLSETLFSVKKRGYRKEDVQLRGAGGQPIERKAQITDW